MKIRTVSFGHFAPPPLFRRRNFRANEAGASLFILSYSGLSLKLMKAVMFLFVLLEKSILLFDMFYWSKKEMINNSTISSFLSKKREFGL